MKYLLCKSMRKPPCLWRRNRDFATYPYLTPPRQWVGPGDRVGVRVVLVFANGEGKHVEFRFVNRFGAEQFEQLMGYAVA